MVPRLGLEPRIYSLEGCCLIHSAIGAKNPNNQEKKSTSMSLTALVAFSLAS